MPTGFSPFLLNHNLYPANARIGPANLNDMMLAINGNSGNCLITPAILKHINFTTGFHGIPNLFMQGALAHVQPQQINRRHSHLFLIMQDQIKLEASDLPWKEITDWLSKITIPVIPFGVGANSMHQMPMDLAKSLPSDMVRFLNVLSEKSAYISTRCHYTSDVLTSLGIKNIKITGCPSYFSRGPHFLAKKPALTAKQKKSGQIAGTGLFACAEPERVHYFLQSEALFINALYRLAPPPHLAALADVTYPDYSRQSIAAFKSKRMQFHITAHSWMEALGKNFIFACGTRVHGTIAALQSGIPALCTAGDMRSKGLCSYFHIPHLPGEAMTGLTAEQIYGRMDVDLINQIYPQRYAHFVDFMKVSGLSPRYLDS